MLGAYVFRCGEVKIKSDDDTSSLTLTHLTASESIIDLRTEETFAHMCLNIKGTPYIILPTTDNITMYKDTSIVENLTTGNTTTHGDLTITGKLTYNVDSSIDTYTKTDR